MEYCRDLKFEQEPDYKYCIGLFDKCMERLGEKKNVMNFCWKPHLIDKDDKLLKLKEIEE